MEKIPVTIEFTEKEFLEYSKQAAKCSKSVQWYIKSLLSKNDSQKEKDDEPKNHHKPWNHEEELIVIEKFKRGYDVTQIAEEVGRTRHAILSRLKHCKLLFYDSVENTYKEICGTRTFYI